MSTGTISAVSTGGHLKTLILHIYFYLIYFRIVDGFMYGLLSRGEKESNRQKAKYERMMDEDVDGTLVRMFEAFMQAAPQMVLQFYIMSQLQLDAGPLVREST